MRSSRTHHCWRSGATGRRWPSPAPRPSRARRGGDTPALPAFLGRNRGCWLDPLTPGGGTAGGLGRSLPLSTWMLLAGNSCWMQTPCFAGSGGVCCSKQKASPGTGASHCAVTVLPATLISLKLRSGRKRGIFGVAGKNNVLRAARGARHFWRGRYLRAALLAHGAAALAPAPRR